MVAQRAHGETGFAHAQVPAADADRLYGRKERRRRPGRRGRRRGGDGRHHRDGHADVPRRDADGPPRRLVHQAVRQVDGRESRRRFRNAGGQLLARHHRDAAGDHRLSRHRRHRLRPHQRPEQRRRLDAPAQDEPLARRPRRSGQSPLPEQRRQPRHHDAARHPAGGGSRQVDAVPHRSEPRSRSRHPPLLLGLRKGNDEAVRPGRRRHPALRGHPRDLFPVCPRPSPPAAAGHARKHLRPVLLHADRLRPGGTRLAGQPDLDHPHVAARPDADRHPGRPDRNCRFLPPRHPDGQGTARFPGRRGTGRRPPRNAATAEKAERSGRSSSPATRAWVPAPSAPPVSKHGC